MKKYLVLLFAAFIAVSCNDLNSGDTLYSGCYSMVDVKSGAFNTDDGYVFNVMSDNSDMGWKSLGRIVIAYDILKGAGSQAHEYPIRLHSYLPVESKSCLVGSKSDQSVYGNDPVAFYQYWGYNNDGRISLCCKFTYVKDSDTKHTFDLVFDDVRSSSDTLFFSLCHNGFNETYSNETYSEDVIAQGYKYLTFDLSGCIPDNVHSDSKICIEWDWYEVDINDLITGRDVEHKTLNGSFPPK